MNTQPMTLAKYLSIFEKPITNEKINTDEFGYIGFDAVNRIILITLKDNTKYQFPATYSFDFLMQLLSEIEPKLEFVGFQHSIEGNSFSTFAVLERNNG